MVPFKPKKPTATIVHPGNEYFGPNELSVTIEKPSRVARAVYTAALEAQRRYEPAIDPATKKAILNKSETAVMTLDIPLPFLVQPAVEFLGTIVTNISGLGDEESGEPLKMTPAKRLEAIGEFAEDQYNVPVVRPIPVMKDGEPTGETEERALKLPFMIYLLEKINEEGTFGGPLDNTRTKPSGDSSSVS